MKNKKNKMFWSIFYLLTGHTNPSLLIDKDNFTGKQITLMKEFEKNCNKINKKNQKSKAKYMIYIILAIILIITMILILTNKQI